MNIYVIYFWIVVDEEMNERLLLNFKEIFFFDEFVIWGVDYDI